MLPKHDTSGISKLRALQRRENFETLFPDSKTEDESNTSFT